MRCGLGESGSMESKSPAPPLGDCWSNPYERGAGQWGRETRCSS